MQQAMGSPRPQHIAHDPHLVRPAKSTFARAAWGGLGSFAVVLGVIGLVVPGWPTTIFLIIAAACYAHSSQRMYDRIVGTRVFGAHVRRFRETGAMPRRAKMIALGTMWPFVLFAVLLAIPEPMLWARALTAILAVIGTAYILHLPTSR